MFTSAFQKYKFALGNGIFPARYGYFKRSLKYKYQHIAVEHTAAVNESVPAHKISAGKIS